MPGGKHSMARAPRNLIKIPVPWPHCPHCRCSESKSFTMACPAHWVFFRPTSSTQFLSLFIPLWLHRPLAVPTSTCETRGSSVSFTLTDNYCHYDPNGRTVDLVGQHT